MINKIKDFLAKMRRQKNNNEDLADRDDQLEMEQDLSSEKTGFISVNPKQEIEDSNDFNGETTPLSKPNFKSRFEGSFDQFKNKFSSLKTSSKSSGTSVSLVKISKFLMSLLSPESREYIHRLSLITFSLLLAYSMGKITALLLKGKPQFESTKVTEIEDFKSDFNVQSLTQVKTANPFKTNVIGEKPKLADSKCEKANQRTSLPLKLMNSIVLQDEVKSIASVQVRSDRTLKEVRIGDNIDQMAKVFKIDRLSLVIKNLETGACESVESDSLKNLRQTISVMSPQDSKVFKDQQKKMQGIDNQGNKFTISKKLLSEKMKDIGTILTQAEAIKVQNPDGTLSFKITNIEPGSIYSFIGIEDQDMISSINGRPITDINDIMNMFGNIESVSQLQLGVRRGGEEVQLDYNMKQ